MSDFTDLLTDSPDICANDLVLAKEMADILHQHYPGHLWGVQVQGAQGVAVVYNLMLDTSYGFRLKLVKEYSASHYKRRVIQAGGEILERYNLTRGKADIDEMDAVPLNFAGRAIGDVSR